MQATRSICCLMLQPTLLLLFVLVITDIGYGGPPQSSIAAENVSPQAASLNPLLQRLQKATVRISAGGDRCSGVLLSPSGLILTVAHGLPSVGSPAERRPVAVVGWDGRLASAGILLQDTVADVALLQLIDADFSDCGSIAPALLDATREHEHVLAAGFPGREQNGHPAVVRIGRLTMVQQSFVRSSCSLTVGDSGGPLINLHGQLLGIHRRIGLATDSNHHIPLNILLPLIREWVQPEIADVSEHPLTELNQLLSTPPAVVATRLKQWTVRVLQDPATNPVANTQLKPQPPLTTPLISGTVLDDTTVATKFSELRQGQSFLCQWSDGTKRRATLLSVDRQLDLALLKLESPQPPPELPLLNTDRTKDAETGVVVFASRLTGNAEGLDDKIAIGMGIITRDHHQEASIPVRLGAVLEADDAGQLEVREVIPGSAAFRAGVQIGDVVTTADQLALNSLESLAELLRQREPGDWLNLQVTRQGQILQLQTQLSPDAGNQFAKSEYLDGRAGQLSLRRSGFHGVLQHDIVLAPVECGSPLVDSAGRLIAINIARRGRESTLALPVGQLLRMLPLELPGDSQSRTTNGSSND